MDRRSQFTGYSGDNWVIAMKQFVQSFLEKFGYRLVKIDALCRTRYGLTTFFPLMKQLGFTPASIVDVGANHGDWTRTALRYFPDAQYTLIEPQDQLKVHIQDLIDRGYRIRWISAGAGDQPGVIPFSISHRDDSCTFAIDELEARSLGYQRVDVNIVTLNDICKSQDIPMPDMVKIDAEGFDLKVLQGASELLGKTEIFLVEFGIFCGYENSLLELVRWMTNHGYRPLDITDLNRSPKHGILWLGEMAFVRIDTQLLDRVASYE
jgi:FkbM family methyltransferase